MKESICMPLKIATITRKIKFYLPLTLYIFWEGQTNHPQGKMLKNFLLYKKIICFLISHVINKIFYMNQNGPDND